MIYYYFSSDVLIWFMTIYDKDEMSDLSPAEKKALRETVALEVKARTRKKKGN